MRDALPILAGGALGLLTAFGPRWLRRWRWLMVLPVSMATLLAATAMPHRFASGMTLLDIGELTAAMMLVNLAVGGVPPV